MVPFSQHLDSAGDPHSFSHCVLWALFAGLLWPGREFDPVMPRLRMNGAIPPLTIYTHFGECWEKCIFDLFHGPFFSITVKKLRFRCVNFLNAILFS